VAYIIKRYSNRKLYDQQTSHYVTLDEIKQLISNGTEVRVEDADSGEDLTSLTLTQILLESERTHQAALPSALLHQLIQHGEAWYDFLDHALRSASFDRLSGTPHDVARFWTDWASRAGWRPPTAASETPAAAATEAGSVEDELSALKAKLLSLEERLGEKKGGTGRKRPARPSQRRQR
jgi:polyhydroxyalkanoate synthesis repressor PhaR